MNNNRKRHILSKQDNIVKVTTVNIHESLIPLEKAINYLKQGYTVKDLLKGIKVTLYPTNPTTNEVWSFSAIDKFSGVTEDLTKLYKEEEKLNIIRDRDANLRLTNVGLRIKWNEKNLAKDRISADIRDIFSSNRNLLDYACIQKY